jgi:hypothetical protein
MTKPMMGDIHDGDFDPGLDDDEGGSAGSALTPLPMNDAMVDVQVATAKKFPRSIAKFRKTAESLACLDPETAKECLYAIKRGGKVIAGPSVRFAEIVAYAWGNSRAEAEVIEEGATHVKARGTFYDLERNIAVRKVVARRITDKEGRRYNEDMIGVTGNAASSIAHRNAVFAGVPKAIWKMVYEKARKVSIGKAGTLTQARQATVDWFGKSGVKPEQVFAWLDVAGIEDIGEEHLMLLNGLAQSLKDGATTIEAEFNPRTAGNGGATPDLNARLNQAAAQKSGNGGAQPADTRTQEEKDLEEDRRIQAEEEAREKGGKR